MAFAPALELSKVAELTVSAASGLVAQGDLLYVVADDETHLAVYGLDGSPRADVPLFAGALPDAHAERKRHKPDLEALTALPDGRLLAFGSGSTDRRARGALIDPARGLAVRSVDLAPLYRVLGAALPELNVEGATVLGDRLVLLQRGNGAARANARIDLDLARVLAAFDGDGSLAEALIAIVPVPLPDLAGVPLGFTDAAVWADRLLFTAAAEDTDDTYADGACTGSVLGELRGGAVDWARQVQPACKLEGLACTADGALYLVADPDDRSIRATLFQIGDPLAICR